MDFSRLQNLNLDFHSSNATMTSLPSTLMEALIPGYGIFSQLIFRFFGFDIGLVVSGCLVVFGLVQGAQFFYNRVYGYFLSYFTSSIYIEDNDKLYSQFMAWLAEQRMTKISRGLKAVTKWISHDHDADANVDDDDVLDDRGLFNFEKWASTVPPRYEPYYGSDRFYHEGRCFMFSRERREQKRNPWGHGDDEYLVITCNGRSTKPIQDLLNHIKTWRLMKENKKTVVYRPAPKEGPSDREWDRQSCRPSRPMSTVSLDQHQKAKIVTDINEYLHPATARWYAARGIPYRRGYLFHGPPGTGKTSLSFALAGIFGLDIYCISLNEVGLTESDLSKLFSELPRRCIVLLEDIDSAGLRRDNISDSSTSADPSSPTSESVEDSEDGITKINTPAALMKDQSKAHPMGASKSWISLSGLLNIIDGAASHEGRVLIMTTNCPEKLDSALIRPGRVDMQVLFTLATHEQTRDIFTRMYSTEHDEKKNIKDDIADTAKKAPKKVTSITKKANNRDHEFVELLAREPVLDMVGPEKLAEMAQQFAVQLPEDKFSPAEIQGYLLMLKREPRKAVEEVGKWRDEMLEAKRRGKKIVNVQ